MRWAHTRHVQGHGQYTVQEVNEIPYVRHSKHTSHRRQEAFWVTVVLNVTIMGILHSFTFFLNGGSTLHTASVIPIRITTEAQLKRSCM